MDAVNEPETRGDEQTRVCHAGGDCRDVYSDDRLNVMLARVPGELEVLAAGDARNEQQPGKDTGGGRGWFDLCCGF